MLDDKENIAGTAATATATAATAKAAATPQIKYNKETSEQVCGIVFRQ